MKLKFEPLYFLFATLLALVVAIGWEFHEQTLLKEAADNYNRSVQTSETLTLLKKRWNNSDLMQQKITLLLSSPSLTHQERKGKKLVLEYANLSQNEFDQIISTLLNNPFIITKLVVSRNSSGGMLNVEIEQ